MNRKKAWKTDLERPFFSKFFWIAVVLFPVSDLLTVWASEGIVQDVVNLVLYAERRFCLFKLCTVCNSICIFVLSGFAKSFCAIPCDSNRSKVLCKVEIGWMCFEQRWGSHAWEDHQFLYFGKSISDVHNKKWADTVWSDY